MDLRDRVLDDDDIAELFDLTDDHVPARTLCRRCRRPLLVGKCPVRMSAIGLLIGAGEWERAHHDQPVIDP